MNEVGVFTAACASGLANQMPGACPWCSSGMSATFHGGACPRVKAIEYHPCGQIKRVEFHAEPPVNRGWAPNEFRPAPDDDTKVAA